MSVDVRSDGGLRAQVHAVHVRPDGGRAEAGELNGVRGDQYLSGSGFDDNPSFDGRVLSPWCGRTDDLPWFVMARTASAVTRVVATTDLGTDVELTLSAFIPEFGSRFAAAGLPDGERPSSPDDPQRRVARGSSARWKTCFSRAATSLVQ
jgi:hypothetical protein